MGNKRIVYKKSAWIYIKNCKVLTAKTKGYSAFFLPGGGIEKKETRKEALMREIKEELDINLIPKTIKYIKSFKASTYEDPENSDVVIYCFAAKFDGSLKASSEIEKFAWFSFKNKNRMSQVDQKVLEYLKSKKIVK